MIAGFATHGSVYEVIFLMMPFFQKNALDPGVWLRVIILLDLEKGDYMGWTVREIAKLTGISVDSLRYYDRLGLVSPKRKNNKYRHYDERDLVLLQYIAVMKYACFSLVEIKSVLRSALEDPSEECARRNADILKCKRMELLSKIANFKGIIKLIGVYTKVYC